MFILTSAFSWRLISCQAGLVSDGGGGGNRPIVIGLTGVPVPGASAGIDLNIDALGKFTKASMYGSPWLGKSAVGFFGNAMKVGTTLPVGLAAPAPAAVGAGLAVVHEP